MVASLESFDIAKLSQPGPWALIAPGYPISNSPFLPTEQDAFVPDERLAEAEASLLGEGYFVLPGVFSPAESGRAADLIQSVTAAGLPPPFALVYDCIWEMVGRLSTLFGRLYGNSPVILPDFWVWQLDGRYESSGWGWHRDDRIDQPCFDASGRPSILTVWLAFTDATPDNGCMQVLPRHLEIADPRSSMRLPETMEDQARSLPAPAGSILAWDMHVLHRGGRFKSTSSRPRISLGIYVKSSTTPTPDSQSIRQGDQLSLMDRLGIISKMVLRYADLYAFRPDLLASCSRWALLYDLAHRGTRRRTP